MTNLAKTIAALGVAAGLGVATLPLSSYAETKTVTWGAAEATQGTDYGGGTGSEDKWVRTSTDVSLTINEVLSIESDNQSVTLQRQASGTSAVGLYTGDKAVSLTVKTNDTDGYTLTISGAGTEAGHKSDLGNGVGDYIVAGDLKGESGAALTDSEWGFYVGNTAESSQTWTAVTDGGVTLGQKDAATIEAGDEYKVNFGAEIVDGQAAGNYTGKVMFTATNKPTPTPTPTPTV